MRAIDADGLKAELIVLSLANSGKSIDIMAVIDAQPAITERTDGTRTIVSGVPFCNKCNQMVDKKYNYCPNCGAKFKEADNG